MANRCGEAAGIETIGDQLAHMAARRGDAIAYIDRDLPVTYAQVDRQAQVLAVGMRAMGLARGDRIGLIGLNHLEWLLVFYAAMRIGVAVVGMSVRYRDGELGFMVEDSRVKAVFTVPEVDGFDFLAMFERLAPLAPSLQQVVVLGGFARGRTIAGRPLVGLDSLLAPASPPFDTGAGAGAGTHAEADAAPATAFAPPDPVNGDDLAMIIYTSGTTGRPKGAGLTHRSILASAAAQAAHTRTGPDDLMQMALPLNHVGGITCSVLAMLVAGGTIDLVPAFKANLVIDMMLRRPPTMMGGVPTMLTLLLMSARLAAVDLSRVRVVFGGGSSVDDTLIRRLGERMPQATFMNLYGLSEASGAIVMTPWDSSEEERLTTIGRPLAGADVRVIDRDGSEVTDGGIGELQFRGLGIVPGYIGAASNAAFGEGGWFASGDLGRIDDRGMISLMGRAKDMFIQGGFNVYPAEVEAVIAQHPQVLMVAGIGVADPVMGEVGCYFVIPRPGAQPSEADLRLFCAQRLADYKVPRQFVFRNELPMTPAGKIHKAALRQEQAPEA